MSLLAIRYENTVYCKRINPSCNNLLAREHVLVPYRELLLLVREHILLHYCELARH